MLGKKWNSKDETGVGDEQAHFAVRSASKTIFDFHFASRFSFFFFFLVVAECAFMYLCTLVIQGVSFMSLDFFLCSCTSRGLVGCYGGGIAA